MKMYVYKDITLLSHILHVPPTSISPTGADFTKFGRGTDIYNAISCTKF